jgi:MoxR-like ATPase
MSVFDQIGDLEAFAKIPPEGAEKELAKVLRESRQGFKLYKFGEWLTGEAPNRPIGAKLDEFGEVVFGRLRQLVAEVGRAFEQRSAEIEVVTAGFVSGVSVLLLGPPGTAKSALIRRIASLCGLAPGQQREQQAGAASTHGGYFEYLLTNHTVPEELFGGPDLGELSQGRFSRVIEGKLPCAEIAFLDEVFRGGSHILNTLLTIINEKRYDSGKGAVHVPLLGVVGAANHAKLDQEMEAFFDRFPIRVWVRSVLEPENRFARANANANANAVGSSAKPGATVAARLSSFGVQAEIDRLAEAWDQARADQARDALRVSCTNDFRVARVALLQKLVEAPANSPRFQ